MKAVLICPSERPAPEAFATKSPFALLPILGRNLVHYWLSHLAAQGAKQVLILAADRPEAVRAYVGSGARWGLKVEVIPEVRELSPEEARQKYCQAAPEGWLSAPQDVVMLDHLPCLSKRPLSENYSEWFQTLVAWIQYAQTPDRIGVREIQPGVWAGLRARISPLAELKAPCWIGEDVQIGDHAVVGPMAIIEDRSFVETGALISHSWVGPDTYTGEFTALMNSMAWGNTLVNWELGSATRVPDKFLLCSLRAQEPGMPRVGWFARLLAVLAILLTLPFGLLAISKAFIRNQRPFRRRQGVWGLGYARQPFDYLELTQASPWFARWPQLWNILKGEMDWVGNRPLTAQQSAELLTDFERQWLATAPGLVSLGDTKGCLNQFNDQAKAHAAFYTATHNLWLDISILADALAAWMLGDQTPRLSDRVTVSFRSVVAAAERIHIWTFKT
jgi:hypothetical protein